MTTNEMLAVIEREIQLLDADNWHAAASIMREAARHLRARADIERSARVLHSLWTGETSQDWLEPESELNAAMHKLGEAVAKVPHSATPSAAR